MMEFVNSGDFFDYPLVLCRMKGYRDKEAIQEDIAKIISHPECTSQRCLLALPYAVLHELMKENQHPHLILGGLEMNSIDSGSFTEEIAATMLKIAGAKFVLIGSFESQLIKPEFSESINGKIRQALASGIRPLFCIGETFEERLEGKSFDVISAQINGGLKDFNEEQLKEIVIVCEAPWLPKNFERVTPQLLLQVYSEYQEIIKHCLGESLSQKMRIIYPIAEEVEEISQVLSKHQASGFYPLYPEGVFRLLDHTSHFLPPVPAPGEVSEQESPLDSALEEEKSKEEESALDEVLESNLSENHIEEKSSVESEQKILKEPLEDNVDGEESEDSEMSRGGEALEEKKTLSLEELKRRLEALDLGNKALVDCYQVMQEKAQHLADLRAEFPEHVQEVNAALSKLDPAMQKRINEGDFEYFKTHPEVLDQVRPALELIQKINDILQESVAIPKDVDHLKSKSKEVRNVLETSWEYFVANRRIIKEQFPDIEFPAIPSELTHKEPVIELTVPEDRTQPYPLLGKRIGIVKP